MKKKLLVTCCLVATIVACPITGNAAMERHPINPIILSDDSSYVMTENELLIGLLREDIKRYELAGDGTQREKDLRADWVKAQAKEFSTEEILQKIQEVAEELLEWQKNEVSCYLGMDDESLTNVINDSNDCYEIVYQILRALGVDTQYLTLNEMKQS